MLPGCGFGFWYIYGIFHQMKERRPQDKMFMLGKSGGAVVCFLSLLKDEYQQFPFLLRICEELKEEEDRKCVLNLHSYVRNFCERLVPYIDESRLFERFAHMQITTTKVTTCMLCMPSKLEMEAHTPESIEDMVDLVCASCYVPMLSRTDGNPCCYTMDDQWVIDGAFLDLFFETEDKSYGFQKIHSEYSQFSVPTRSECIEMYYSGYLNKYPDTPPNRKMVPRLPFENIPSVFSSYKQLYKHVHQAGIPLVLTDEAGVVITLNEEWTLVCNYTLEQLRGSSLKKIQGAETDPSTVNKINTMLEKDEYVDEVVINYKNGGVRFLNRVRIKPVFVPNADPHSPYLLTRYFISQATDLKSPPHII